MTRRAQILSVLRDAEPRGLTDSQVARIVGIPLGAARLYLARLALRDRADRPTRYGAPWRSRPAYRLND